MIIRSNTQLVDESTLANVYPNNRSKYNGSPLAEIRKGEYGKPWLYYEPPVFGLYTQKLDGVRYRTGVDSLLVTEGVIALTPEEQKAVVVAELESQLLSLDSIITRFEEDYRTDTGRGNGKGLADMPQEKQDAVARKVQIRQRLKDLDDNTIDSSEALNFEVPDEQGYIDKTIANIKAWLASL
jgi:hypothetical protein